MNNLKKNKLWRRGQVVLGVLAVCLVISVLPLAMLVGGKVVFNGPVKQIDHRPAEKLICSVPSPDQKHLAKYYTDDGAGATVDRSATVIIEAQNGGKTWKNKKQWCLYWAYHVGDSLEIEWLDNETLKVTETIEQVSFELPIYADQTDWMPSNYN